MTAILEILAHELSSTFFPPKPNGLNAQFGDESLIASSFNKGILISKNKKLTRQQSFQNVMICGGTGSGKTSRYLIKAVLELKNASIIINDPSKEVHKYTSGYLSNKGFLIKTLNFSESSISSGYNLLSRVKKSNDANKLANILVTATLEKGNGGGDPFWSLQTKNLLTILLRLIQYQPEQYRNMANVQHLLSVFAIKPQFIDALILGTKDKNLIMEFKSLIATSEKTMQSITSSAKASLQAFSDEEVRKVTSIDTISFEEFRQRPTVLYLHNSIADMKYNTTITSIFFQQFYEFILSRLPYKNELDVFVMLEEASSLFVPVLSIALANTRKHRVGNILLLQSENQLNTLYGNDDAKNLSSNCITKIYLPGISNLNTLRDLEALSGKTTYKDESGKEKTKSLLTIDELRLLNENLALILCANHPFILAKTSPYYLSFKYSRRASYPPAPFKGEIPQSPIRLIGEKPTEESNTQTNN